MKSNKHWIALELSYGTIYCYLCKDFTYDYRCEEISSHHRRLESLDLQKSLPYRPWCPTPTEIKLLLNNPQVLEVHGNKTIGLRGLINLGATCFMNCIVQVCINLESKCSYTYLSFLPGTYSHTIINRLFFVREPRVQ